MCYYDINEEVKEMKNIENYQNIYQYCLKSLYIHTTS